MAKDCSLIVVNGWAIESGMESLNIFDFSIVGLPLIFIGIIYLLIFGPKLLPEKADPIDTFSETERDYVVEVRVNSD